MDDNYLEFVKWGVDHDLGPLSRTQYVFATFLIANSGSVNKIGDLEYVFKMVRRWLKTNPEFWVEHHPMEEIIIKEPPADFSGESVAFNWGLPMKEIEYKFKNKKPFEEIQEPASLLDFEKDLYKSTKKVKPASKIIPAPPPITDDVIFIGKRKTRYHCIGHLSKTLNSKPKDTPVYYNHINDDYAVEALTTGIYPTYNYSTIKDMVSFNGELPNGIPLPMKTHIKELFDSTPKPSPNFHYE